MVDSMATLRKRGGIYTDMLAAGVGSALLPSKLAWPVQLVGQLYGGTNDNIKPVKGIRHIVPGLGDSSLMQQRRKLTRDYGGKRDVAVAMSERFGHIAAGLTPALLLAAAGGLLASRMPDKTDNSVAAGALIGGGLGMLLGPLAGAATAGITRTRTKEEQRKYEADDGAIRRNWLIPGASTYNHFKAMGRLHADQVEDEEAAAGRGRNRR